MMYCREEAGGVGSIMGSRDEPQEPFVSVVLPSLHLLPAMRRKSGDP